MLRYGSNVVQQYWYILNVNTNPDDVTYCQLLTRANVMFRSAKCDSDEAK